MKTGIAWCHHCNCAVMDFMTDFISHASRGHAITDGPCTGTCQFLGAAS